MAEVTIGPSPVARFYKQTVTAVYAGIPAGYLEGRGQQVCRAVGKVGTESVNMGMQDLINPSNTVGFTLAAGDIIVLEGYDNIKRATFAQNSGGSTINWMLSTAML